DLSHLSCVDGDYETVFRMPQRRSETAGAKQNVATMYRRRGLQADPGRDLRHLVSPSFNTSSSSRLSPPHDIEPTASSSVESTSLVHPSIVPLSRAPDPEYAEFCKAFDKAYMQLYKTGKVE